MKFTSCYLRPFDSCHTATSTIILPIVLPIQCNFCAVLELSLVGGKVRLLITGKCLIQLQKISFICSCWKSSVILGIVFSQIYLSKFIQRKIIAWNFLKILLTAKTVNWLTFPKTFLSFVIIFLAMCILKVTAVYFLPKLYF